MDCSLLGWLQTDRQTDRQWMGGWMGRGSQEGVTWAPQELTDWLIEMDRHMEGHRTGRRDRSVGAPLLC